MAVNGPTPEARRELERILEEDDTRAGQVYRLTKRGLNPDQIATELGVSTSGFVSNNRTMARALLEAHIPGGPSAAQQVLSFVRKVSRSSELSADAQRYLTALGESLARTAGDRQSGPEALRRQSPPRGRATAAPPRSLRGQMDGELRERTKALVARIQAETGVEAIDYWSVVTDVSPLDAVVRLLGTRAEEGTLPRLAGMGRLDLSLDSAVIVWSADLPIQADLVDQAVARRDWLSR